MNTQERYFVCALGHGFCLFRNLVKNLHKYFSFLRSKSFVCFEKECPNAVYQRLKLLCLDDIQDQNQ